LQIFGAEFVQTLITVIAVGSLYALVALGYTMVYGILKFINFAHSDVFVLGAWTSLTAATFIISRLGLAPHVVPPWWVGPVVLVLAMLVCATFGFVIERFAYKPLRRAPRLNVLITAIGVSLLLQNCGQLPSYALTHDLKLPFGPSPQRMPALLPDDPASTAIALEFPPRVPGGSPQRVLIGLIDAVIVGSALALLAALEILVYRTKMGMGMRALSYNVDTAALMGVPVNRVVSFTFVIGASLAAAAGFLYALKYPGLNQPAHEIWVLLGLKAFVAAVVGGIGNVRGAALGGYLIAAIEFFGMLAFGTWIDPLLGTNLGTNLRDVYVFTVLIIVLLVRPSGLLGPAAREKV
jgi:branched-chain amino acid transport system permease protein